MVEKYVTQPSAIARLQSNVFGPYLAALVQSLERAEYAAETIRLHLRAVTRFGRWVQRRRIPLEDLTEETVVRYVQSLQQPSRTVGPRRCKALGLCHLLTVLRQQGVILVPHEPPPSSSTGTCRLA